MENEVLNVGCRPDPYLETSLWG